jgi:hypothetical protein
MVKILDSWYVDGRKQRAADDMQLSELSVVWDGEAVWLCADDPPEMHGEDASGYWVALSVEDAWALVDQVRATIPPRDAPKRQRRGSQLTLREFQGWDQLVLDGEPGNDPEDGTSNSHDQAPFVRHDRDASKPGLNRDANDDVARIVIRS